MSDAAPNQPKIPTEPTVTQLPFKWSQFIASAYLPSFLSFIGYGAATPLVALSAISLGASVGLSALIAALTGIGMILGDLPASWVATRFGEKKAMTLACLWDAIWLTVAFLASSLPVLSLAVFCFGLSGSVFGLARQSYITEIVPLKFRARALSSLGGTQRVGGFVGPLIASAIISWWDLQAAYGFAAIMSVISAIVTMVMPDLPDAIRQRRAAQKEPARLFAILAANRHTFLTLGVGVLFVGMVRAVRQTVLPLWCESLNMDPAHTSLVYALSMGVDMSLFFVGGFIMDRFGRMWVAVPSLVVLGMGLISLSLAHSVAAVIVVAIVLGLGNGVGAGIVMTIGSDSAPVIGRAQFLSGWRLFGDTGGALGPLILSGITAALTLTAATIGMGALGLVGAGWLGYWIRHSPIGSMHRAAARQRLADTAEH
ncbi:MAG: MFS transporter [Propionibacteriaceae bacterium]|jgi:MFS family permease|nr:MFS transporter [Propionibacteriaceae bacterium]